MQEKQIRKMHQFIEPESTDTIGTERFSTFNMNQPEYAISRMVFDGTHCYATTSYYPPYVIIKINMLTMTRVTSYEHNSLCSSMITHGGYLYATFNISNSIILKKINTDTMTDELSISIPGVAAGSIIFEGHLYIINSLSSSSYPVKLFKVDLADLSILDEISFPQGLTGIAFDENNIYVSTSYVSSTISSYIHRLNPITLEIETSVIMPISSINYLVVTPNSVLAATTQTNPNIYRIDKSTMLRTNNRIISGSTLRINALMGYGTSVFATFNSSPTAIWEMNDTTLANISTFTAVTGEGNSKGLVITPDYLYISLGPTSYGLSTRDQIQRVNKSTMTRIDRLYLNYTEGTASSYIVHGKYLYIFPSNAEFPKTLKIDLETMTREEHSIFISGIKVQTRYFTVINNHIYTIAGNNPGTLYKISLDNPMTLTTVGTIPLSGWPSPLSCTTDGTHLFAAYMLSSNSYIVKFDPDTMQVLATSSGIVGNTSSSDIIYHNNKIYHRQFLSPNDVYAYNSSDLSLVSPNIASGANAMMLANNHLYVTKSPSSYENTLLKYELENYTIVKSTNLGTFVPGSSMVYNPDQNAIGIIASPQNLLLLDEDTLELKSSTVLSNNTGMAVIYTDGEHYRTINTNLMPGRVDAIRVNREVQLPYKTLEMTLPTGDNYGIGCSDGTHMYMITYSTPTKVFRILPDNIAIETVATLTTSSSVRKAVIYGDYIYMLGTTKVEKLNKNNLEIESEFLSETEERDLNSISTDGTYLYIGTDTTPGRIIKINATTMLRVKDIIMPFMFNGVLALSYHDNHIYANVRAIPLPSKVVKISSTDLTLVDYIEMKTRPYMRFNDTEQATAVSAVDQNFLYVGTSVVNTTQYISKISLSDFGRIIYKITTPNWMNGGVTLKRDRLYVGHSNGFFVVNTSNGEITQITTNLSTAWTPSIIPYGNDQWALYVGAWSPSTISKVRLKDHSVIAHARKQRHFGHIRYLSNLAEPNWDLFCIAYSPDGKLAVLGGWSTGFARLYSVGSAGLTYIDNIYADSGTTALNQRVWGAAFSPDGTKLVLVGEFTNRAKIYSVSGTTVTFVSDIYADTGTTILDSRPFTAAFSPDGSSLIIGGTFMGKAKIYSVSGTTVTFVSNIYADSGTTALSSTVYTAIFSLNGDAAVLGGNFTGYAKIYSVSGTTITFVSNIYADTDTTALGGGVNASVISPRGTELVLGGAFAGRAKVYSISGTTATYMSDIASWSGETQALTFSPDGTMLVAGGIFAGYAEIYSVNGATITYVDDIYADASGTSLSDWIYAAGFSPPDDNFLIVGGLAPEGGHLYDTGWKLARKISHLE